MEQSSPKASEGQAKPAKAYSCIRCFERKVKCDKESPCGNCAKSGVECVFRVPPPPRRRKKRTQEEILKARLTQYEDILRAKGIDVYKDGIRAEDLPDATPASMSKTISETSPSESMLESLRTGVGAIPNRAFVKPSLIVDEGRTRFISNNLWTSMAEEFRKPGDAMQESSDEDDDETVAGDNIEFVLGATPNSMGVRELHPLPEQVFTFWQIFLENVNPLSKLVHAPSTQPAIIEASNHLDRLPKNFECLLFAIYSLAVLSLEPQECEEMLGEKQTVLLSRYRAGTKRALARAKFMGTSDIMVLIAFVLHLLCMREVYDTKTLWTLTGVGNRIAEGMGIHRDGTSLGLPPFETEIRRRVWWQLLFLDFRTAELAGSGTYGNFGSWDVRTPSNVNDEDIWPGMKEEPVPKERNTEMIFCLTRYELGMFWKQKLLTKEPQGDFGTLWENFRRLAAIDEKEKGIEELERMLEHKYARFCDPSIPIEFMAILVIRAAANGMRLMTHHPRRYAKDEDVPESERQLCWTIGCKLLELDNLVHSSKPMNRFRWHMGSYFQWQALIYMLTELRRQPLQEQADRGWQIVHEIFEHHPTFVTEVRKPIHFAVGSLAVKAWRAREQTWSRRPAMTPMIVPDYIRKLQKDREEKAATPMPKTSRSDYFSWSDQNREALAGRGSALTMYSVQPVFSETDENMQLESTPSLQSQSTTTQDTSPMQFPLQLQQKPLPPPLQFNSQQDVSQQPPLFWWDFPQNNNVGMDPMFDFNLDPLVDNMDWSQWDVLLKTNRPAG